MNPQWQFNPLAIPFALSTLLTLGLITLGLRHRRTALVWIYLAFMVSLLIWTVASMLEILTLNLELSLFFADISFLGITMFSVLWLGIAMVYDGKERLFQKVLPALLGIALATNTVIWTNPMHGLWRGNSYRDLVTTWFPISYYEYGPWFYYVHLPYSLIMAVLAFILLLRSQYLKEWTYRQQIILLMVALLLPLMTEVAHRLGFQPIPYFNASALTFPVSAVLVAWAMFDFRFLDISPIARDLVVEHIDDPVIVLDAQERVVDVNPAARRQLWPDNRIIGEKIEVLLPVYVDLDVDPAEPQHYVHEIELEHAGAYKRYELKISPIEWNAGHLLMLRNVTDKHAAMRVTIEQARQVATLEERQRLARELHDSVNQTLFATSTLSDLMVMAIDRKPEKVEQYARDIQQLVRGATSEMRLILMELYPDALVETDLNISIQHLCTAFTGASGVPVDFKPAAQIHLDDEKQIAFYRITQEALQNINKHASASKVIVDLAIQNGEVSLTIKDNGRGFDMDQTLTNHFGLMNMGKRAMMNGLKLSLNSERGNGTQLKLTGATK